MKSIYPEMRDEGEIDLADPAWAKSSWRGGIGLARANTRSYLHEGEGPVVVLVEQWIFTRTSGWVKVEIKDSE